ncbi:MAG: hypothetical protein H6Q13_3540, partial [Bacteroidetes bacterium]|nr:hypothetical protein [Bacteroidota bacterium]
LVKSKRKDIGDAIEEGVGKEETK